MSKIIESIDTRECCDIIQADNGEYYYVDSCFTLDHGYETMTFPYDINAHDVSDWDETYARWYDSSDEMLEGHRDICENYEKYGIDIESDFDDVAKDDSGYLDDDYVAKDVTPEESVFDELSKYDLDTVRRIADEIFKDRLGNDDGSGYLDDV